MDFESQLLKRYNRKKINDRNRVDREGNSINFLLTYEEFRELFLPYKDDVRFYDHSDSKNYLCICRNEDLGDYVIGNVKVSTMSNNSSERNKFNDNRISNENLILAAQKFHKENPDHIDRIRAMRGPSQGWTQSQESIENQKKKFEEIGHQKGETNSQFGTCWIYSLEERISSKIDLKDLDHWLSKGWTKGRKIKF